MSDSSKEEALLAQMREIVEGMDTGEIDMSDFGRGTTIESLGLDSLTFLDLLYDIEQESGIKLEAGELVSIQTIGEILDLLIQKGA